MRAWPGVEATYYQVSEDVLGARISTRPGAAEAEAAGTTSRGDTAILTENDSNNSKISV